MFVPPPNGFSLEEAWPKPSEALCNEVVNFWVGESALSEAAARQRTSELMLVAKDTDKRIAAVCTVEHKHIVQLKRHCFAYRTFVGRQSRTQGLRSAGQLAWSLFTRTYEILNERFVRGEHPDYVGLYMEVENKKIKRHLNQCVWTEDTLRERREVSAEILDQVGPFGMNVVYLGMTGNGDHARIWYFTDSRIPPV